MAGKAEQRREVLRDRLIDSAEATISSKGSAAFKARDLAVDVGCSVGAIYNAFGDLQDIVIAVNGRTFRRLGETVADSLSEMDDGPPHRPADCNILCLHGLCR